MDRAVSSISFGGQSLLSVPLVYCVMKGTTYSDKLKEKIFASHFQARI